MARGEGDRAQMQRTRSGLCRSAEQADQSRDRAGAEISVMRLSNASRANLACTCSCQASAARAASAFMRFRVAGSDSRSVRTSSRAQQSLHVAHVTKCGSLQCAHQFRTSLLAKSTLSQSRRELLSDHAQSEADRCMPHARESLTRKGRQNCETNKKTRRKVAIENVS